MKENQRTEWKETWHDEYLRWICGFANAEGGVLVIGRNDKGEVVGIPNARKLLADLPNKIRDVLGIMADVHLVTKRGKELVEIRVGAYPSPISYKGVESWGRGIEKINRECREHDIPAPAWDFSMAGLMLTFRANSAHLQAAAQPITQPGLGEKLGEKLGRTRAAIVQAMRNNPKITTTMLAKQLSLSTTAVDKNIRYLKLQGQIKRVGPAKGGRWEALK